ncbi:trypsin-like peptidase domain-containing protein [Nonomuraea insulae]|uniref:Trypsin-like peptidase domain-containing protein n=1 Tax=Nonomuraea insulae TaxID=1616787 RepID=A0ABW1CBT5_9ACTN
MTRDPDRPPWLVRVRAAPGTPGVEIGAGLLAAGRHVITCAHVLVLDHPGDAPLPGTPPDVPVDVSFQFCGNEPIPAVVAPGGWFPEPDIAVLELLQDPPQDAAPAPLCTAAGTRGHDITVHGYPRGFDHDAVPSTGFVQAVAGQGWLSLVSKEGINLEAGFSGAPVYDNALDGVIGMVVRRVEPRKTEDPRTGFAITADDLVGFRPELAGGLRRPFTKQERARVEELTTLPLSQDGELLRVRDADMYHLGVTVARGNAQDSPVYVPRRKVDEDLAAALARSFLVAMGPSAAGKSRSLIELLRRERPDAAIIVPRAGLSTVDKLSQMALPLPPQGAVLWLENLNEFLSAQSLDTGSLQRLARHDPPITVVATMMGTAYKELVAENTLIAKTTEAVLKGAAMVEIPAALAAEDRRKAAELYPDDDFSDRGVGEVLVGARQLEVHYKYADSKEGWAVLQAALDWVRTGVRTPIDEPALRELSAVHLAGELPNADPDAAFATGLAWALGKLEGNVYPMVRVREPGGWAYRPHNYLVALASGDRDVVAVRPVPEAVWDLAVAGAPDGDLLALTYTAFVQGLAGVVRKAAARARGLEGEPEIRAWATVLLGAVEGLQNNFDSARALLEEAQVSGIAEVMTLATYELGPLLLNIGDMTRAAEVLEPLFDDPDEPPGLLAEVQLAMVRIRQGLQDEAIELLTEAAAAQPGETEIRKSAVERGGPGNERERRFRRSTARRPDGGLLAGERQEMFQTLQSAGESVAPLLARTLLSGLLVGRGEMTRARELLESVAESQDARVLPLVNAAMGGLALMEEDFEVARDLLGRAVESGHPGAAPAATLDLAELAYREGDEETTRELLDEMVEEDHPDFAPRAGRLLGNLLASQGDIAGAEAAYLRAIEAHNSYWSPMATIELAILLAQQDAGQAPRSRTLLEEVVAEGHPDHAPRAADLLGDLLAGLGDTVGAQAAYRNAIGSGHDYWAPMAKLDLAALLGQLDERPMAAIETLLGEVAGAPHPDHGPRAAEMLGELMAETGRPGEAERHFQEAIDREHPYWSPLAQIGLAATRTELGRHEDVLDLLEAAGGAADAQISAVAHLRRAGLLLDAGRPSEADADLSAAARSTLVEFAALALVEQAKLAVRDGDLERAVARLEDMRERLEPLGTPTSRTRELALPEGTGFAYLRACDFLHDMNELDTARELLEALLDSPLAIGWPGLAAAAQARLGRVRYMEGYFEQARRLLWQALAGDVAYVMPMARAYLASLFMKQDKLSAATEIIEPLVREGDAEYRPFAMALLGRIKVVRGEFGEGRGLLERALEETVATGDEDAATEIRDSLAVLSTIHPPTPDPAAVTVLPDAMLPAAEPPAAEPPSANPTLPAPSQPPILAPPAPDSTGGSAGPGAVTEAGSAVQPEGADTGPHIPGPRAAEPRAAGSSGGGGLPPGVKLSLGEVASAQGAVEEATWWFGEVIAGADPTARALARLALATLHYENGDLDQAAELARSLATESTRAATLLAEIADTRTFHLRPTKPPPPGTRTEAPEP